MKLYKVWILTGDRGVSIFPTEDDPNVPPIEATAFPYKELLIELMKKGYSGDEVLKIFAAWFYYYQQVMKVYPTEVYEAVAEAIHEMPNRAPPPEPIAWAIVAAVAVAAAVVLGLYVWAVLEHKYDVAFGNHPWAYFMSYEERLWQGEIWGVSAKGVGLYERCGEFGEVISGVIRNIGGEKGRDWIEFKPGRVVLKGRHPILYHEYRFIGCHVYFCGLLEQTAAGLYVLRKGGSDTFKPAGPWTRPGGFCGTPTYQGCWQEWWWL
jgi:hypothetical protein